MEALSIVSCVVLKAVLKREYNLSSEQCATFNPKELRQERIKAFPTGGFGRSEDGQVPARNRFPAGDWLEKIWPLVENFGRPEEIISYIRTITDADPWDDSKSRHEAKVDVLEGRRGRKGKGLKATKADASKGTKAAKMKETKPSAGRGRGRGRGEPKGKPAKKKGRRRQAIRMVNYVSCACNQVTCRGAYDSEDDSDWEVHPSTALALSSPALKQKHLIRSQALQSGRVCRRRPGPMVLKCWHIAAQLRLCPEYPGLSSVPVCMHYIHPCCWPAGAG